MLILSRFLHAVGFGVVVAESAPGSDESEGLGVRG
jgi:hypothetical protein